MVLFNSVADSESGLSIVKKKKIVTLAGGIGANTGHVQPQHYTSTDAPRYPTEL